MVYCATCRSVLAKAKDSALFIGVSGDKIRMRALKNDVLTSAHMDCEQALRARANLEEAPLPSYLLRMDQDVKEMLIKQFNIAYYVVKEEEPFITFPKLLNLLNLNGLNLGNTYKNDHACYTFIERIAKTVSDSVGVKRKAAHTFL